MSEPSVSAVIPVYNGERFLRGAVESVQRQAFAPLEILIVDDCSTDRTVTLASALAADDERIRVIRQPANAGPSAARNAALREARGEFVAFLDADDTWLPHHLSGLVRAVSAFPDCPVAFDVARWIPVAEAADPSVAPRRIQTFPLVLKENPVVQSAVLVRRDTLLALGGYRVDLRYGEDYELWMRLALNGHDFVEVPTLGCLRTPHPGQVSAIHAARMYDSAWTIRERAVREHYGGPDNVSDQARAMLHDAMRVDLAGAWHSRRREVLLAAIAAMSWVPGAAQELRRWTSRVRRPAWYLWKGSAMLWDAIPSSLKSRVRR